MLTQPTGLGLTWRPGELAGWAFGRGAPRAIGASLEAAQAPDQRWLMYSDGWYAGWLAAIIWTEQLAPG